MLLAILLAVLIYGIIRTPSTARAAKPIADLYNPVSQKHIGRLIQIEANHRFDDGTVREGWLVRGMDGVETWFPAENLAKLERVKR